MSLLQAGMDWLAARPAGELTWIAIGILGQAMFSGRFLVQWIASERVKRSIVPEAFWYFSMGGGVLLLAYSVYRIDPVFMLGQGLGLVIYLRNIYFIQAERRGRRHQAAAAAAGVPTA